jgi:hypothetical protein
VARHLAARRPNRQSNRVQGKSDTLENEFHSFLVFS